MMLVWMFKYGLDMIQIILYFTYWCPKNSSTTSPTRMSCSNCERGWMSSNNRTTFWNNLWKNWSRSIHSSPNLSSSSIMKMHKISIRVNRWTKCTKPYKPLIQKINHWEKKWKMVISINPRHPSASLEIYLTSKKLKAWSTFSKN